MVDVSLLLRVLHNAKNWQEAKGRVCECVCPFNRVQSRKANPKNLYLIKFHMRAGFFLPRLRLLGITVLLSSLMRVFHTTAYWLRLNDWCYSSIVVLLHLRPAWWWVVSKLLQFHFVDFSIPPMTPVPARVLLNRFSFFIAVY